MSFVEISKPSHHPSISFSILDLKAQAVRLSVSKGSQILLSELLTWSGERRYCWWSIPKIAKDLGWSSSAVWRSSTELKESGLLAVIPRPGRSNYWIPLPGRDRVERLQKELAPLAESRPPFLKEKEKSQKRCTVPDLGTSTEQPPPSPESENVNAIKICPEEMAPLQGTTSDTPLESVQEPIPVPQDPFQPEPIRQKPTPSVVARQPKTKASITPEQIFLVEEIERVTGDTWSRGHFINLVRQTDEQTIYSALSVTREKMSLESGVRGGAYFTATLRGMMGLAGLGQESSGISITQPPLSPPVLTTPARPKSHLEQYMEPEPEPCDPEALKRGWRLHYRGAGIGGMLSLVQRCVPLSVDVRSLWGDVRETFPGMEEAGLVDRFLDVVAMRMRHAEKMAEARV